MNTSGATISPKYTHYVGKLNNTEKLTAIKPLKNRPAYMGDNSPVVKGLAFVRSTFLSISRSQKSLIMQPELRHDRAPTVNRPNIQALGRRVGELRARPQ